MENKIYLINRKNLNISGITKVIEISEENISVQVDNSVLNIAGEGMEVKKLDVESGNLEVEGLINSIKYIDKKEKISLIKRIFK